MNNVAKIKQVMKLGKLSVWQMADTAKYPNGEGKAQGDLFEELLETKHTKQST